MADVVTVLQDNRVVVEVAGADLAAAIATAAVAEMAAQVASDLEEIQEIASGAPDAPSILDKLNKDGDNADTGLLANIGAVASADLADDTGAGLVGFAAGANASSPTTAQTELRQSHVNVLRYGADPTGAADSTAAFNQAILDIQSNVVSGQLFVPRGQYKIDGGAVQADGKRIGVFIGQQTYGGSGFGAQNRVEIVAEPGAILVPGNTNVILLKMCDQFSRVYGLTLDNPSGLATCWGIMVGPQDMGNTTERTFNNYSRIECVNFYNLDEAFVIQPGPTIGGASSPCYYNNMDNFTVAYCKRAIWIKDGVGGAVAAHGANRNSFSRGAVGPFVNTGIQNDGGDTITLDTVHFEGVNDGTSPNTTPTAVKHALSGPVSNWETFNCAYVNCTAEACTRDLDIGQDDTAFINCAFDFRDKAVYTQTPNIAFGKPYGADSFFFQNNSFGWTRYNLGLQLGVGSAITNETVPAVDADFYNTAGGIRQRVKADSGAAQIELDTGGNYGTFRFYSNGTQHWSLGCQLTGLRNITFFDYLDNRLFQIKEEGAIAIRDGISEPATDAGFVSIYVDSADGDLKAKFGDGTVKTIVTGT